MSYEILDSIRFQFLLSPISNSENFEKKFLEKKKRKMMDKLRVLKIIVGYGYDVEFVISIILVEGILKSLCFL